MSVVGGNEKRKGIVERGQKLKRQQEGSMRKGSKEL